MSFDQKWEEIYAENRNNAKYPYDLVISIIKRMYPGHVNRLKILDLGCGSGNHMDFLWEQGFSVYGIDGSKTAIRLLSKKEPNVICGDFLDMPYEPEFFDVILDHHSIYANSLEDIVKIIANCHKILKSKGKIISFMYSSGTFETTANLIDSDVHLFNLFTEFNLIECAKHSCLGHKYIPCYSEYIFIGEKP
jgi:SAM-dependent methyltransferase